MSVGAHEGVEDIGDGRFSEDPWVAKRIRESAVGARTGKRESTLRTFGHIFKNDDNTKNNIYNNIIIIFYNEDNNKDNIKNDNNNGYHYCFY